MLLEALEARIDHDVRGALAEDLGSGDITAQLIPDDGVWEASVYTRENAVLCGRNWFDAVFQHLDERTEIRWYAADGDDIACHQVICTLKGPARCLLSGERTALNFLQTLSGTATLARRYARQVEGYATRILDTRKTIPGLRHAQKYAVRCGGCHNHRFGLYDAFLIKENHIAAAGSIAQEELVFLSVRLARHGVDFGVEVAVGHVEIEVAVLIGVEEAGAPRHA